MEGYLLPIVKVFASAARVRFASDALSEAYPTLTRSTYNLEFDLRIDLQLAKR